MAAARPAEGMCPAIGIPREAWRSGSRASRAAQLLNTHRSQGIERGQGGDADIAGSSVALTTIYSFISLSAVLLWAMPPVVV